MRLTGVFIMKLIKLTKGKFAQVDDDDFEYLNKFKWCTLSGGGSCEYARRAHQSGNKQIAILMQNEIITNHKGFIVDHIDGNTLNNQKNNLRLTTQQKNCFNQKARIGTSKFKGVNYEKNMNKWKSQIQAYGKKIYLGIYKTEIDAAKAYNEAAEKYHGEFARLNII